MINIDQKTAKDIEREVADRMISLRKRKKISQEELAKKSGVSLGSLRRFEQSGEISFTSLCKIAIALKAEDGFDEVFSHVPYGSIEEMLREKNRNN